MTEDKKIEKINKAFSLLMDMEPLIEFKESGNDLDSEMRYGLAQMYANQGFRKYLIANLNQSIKTAALRSESLVDMAFGKSRALTLKELLVKSKEAYENLEQFKILMESKKKVANQNQ